MTLWLASILTPLVLAAALAREGPVRRAALAVAPLAALPAAVLAFVGEPGERVDLGWLLLGASLRLDDVSLVFLAFGAAVWLAAGIYAGAYHRDDPGAHRAFAFFLLAMAGSFLLTLAGDVATFYAGFALMTFSAYVLVIHDGTAEAQQAGKVYIALSMLGEASLLGGFVLAAIAAGTLELAAIPAGVAEGQWTALTIALLLAGFGIKDGLLGLHVWLPLAHPVAPTPSSAVLSGVMIKAGLLGWLVFLPLGAAAIEWAALTLITLGIGGAFFAVAVGVFQSGPKTNLAYSSVSQMGIMTAIVGVALAAPELRQLAAAAIALYALHHGLTKGALFCAVGVDERASGRVRAAVLAAVAVLAAGLAAAPYTAGAVAKQALKDVAAVGPYAPETLVALLTLTGAATTLLLGRLVLLLARAKVAGARPPAGLWVPWAALAAAAAVGAWVAPSLLPLAPIEAEPAGAWASLWPVLLGLAALACGKLIGRQRFARLEARVPAGDLLALGVGAARWVRHAAGPALARLSGRLARGAERGAELAEPARRIGRLAELDRVLERWEVAALSFALVALILGVSLW
jgi:formate hydrogenlyase subunit 3/multisubunit Na+/H+ antiporter MnhD subunit